MPEINQNVFNTFPSIVTDRLVLRELNINESEAVFGMRISKAVNRFIARLVPAGVGDMEILVKQCAAAFTEKRGIAWAGEIKSMPGKIIGTCGYNKIDHDNLRAELGGEMSENYWGRKLAFEATEAIVNFGFESLKLHSLEAKVLPGNRSAIAMLQALGFQQEGYFKERFLFNGKWNDLAIYSLINPH